LKDSEVIDMAIPFHLAHARWLRAAAMKGLSASSRVGFNAIL
jgi:hypothetical protein